LSLKLLAAQLLRFCW